MLHNFDRHWQSAESRLLRFSGPDTPARLPDTPEPRRESIDKHTTETVEKLIKETRSMHERVDKTRASLHETPNWQQLMIVEKMYMQRLSDFLTTSGYRFQGYPQFIQNFQKNTALQQQVYKFKQGFAEEMNKGYLPNNGIQWRLGPGRPTEASFDGQRGTEYHELAEGEQQILDEYLSLYNRNMQRFAKENPNPTQSEILAEKIRWCSETNAILDGIPAGSPGHVTFRFYEGLPWNALIGVANDGKVQLPQVPLGEARTQPPAQGEVQAKTGIGMPQMPRKISRSQEAQGVAKGGVVEQQTRANGAADTSTVIETSRTSVGLSLPPNIDTESLQRLADESGSHAENELFAQEGQEKLLATAQALSQYINAFANHIDNPSHEEVQKATIALNTAHLELSDAQIKQFNEFLETINKEFAEMTLHNIRIIRVNDGLGNGVVVRLERRAS